MNPASNMFCSVKPPALVALVQLISEERCWACSADPRCNAVTLDAWDVLFAGPFGVKYQHRRLTATVSTWTVAVLLFGSQA